jgi:GWxTD domain-containing protein
MAHPSRESLVNANLLITRAVLDQPRWSRAWFALGLVRTRLAQDTIFAVEGPDLPSGASNLLGAANAFERALTIDPAFALAANQLAALPRPREGNDALQQRVTVLRRVRALLSPEALAEAAILERDAGSADSAVALERRALQTGRVDSGVVLLSLARDLYHAGHADDGYAAWILGAKATTAAARRAYHDEMAWVTSPAELAEWDTLSADKRRGWARRFWTNRDVRDGRPSGSRLAEHYRRVEYAIQHFPISLPQTGRPTTLTYTPIDDNRFTAEAAKRARQYPNECPAAANFINDSRMIGADAPRRYYTPIQDQIDDRGVVWIRHGKPDQVRISVTGDIVEVWRYELPTGPLVLQFRAADFQGSSGATVLIPSLLTLPPDVRAQVCDIEISLCPHASKATPMDQGDSSFYPRPFPRERMKPNRYYASAAEAIRKGFLKPETIALETCLDPYARVLEREVLAEGAMLNAASIHRYADEGKAEIDQAVTTDSYFRTFDKKLQPSLQLFGMMSADGSSHVVLAFALPGHQLAAVKPDSTTARVVYPVRIELMTGDGADGSRSDADTTRQFTAAAPLREGQFLTGVTDHAIASGHYDVSVVFSQSDGHGGMASLSDLFVPGPASRLQLSDLVLGRDDSGVHWNSGTTNVALNPLNTWPAGGSATAYFQLSGLTPGTVYGTTFEFLHANDDSIHKPRLSVASNQTARQERMEVSTALGLKNLEPGRYRVRLTVSGAGETAKSVAWLTIVR